MEQSFDKINKYFSSREKSEETIEESVEISSA
jgi:hypothetical protein